jgi:hypothetical protein
MAISDETGRSSLISTLFAPRGAGGEPHCRWRRLGSGQSSSPCKPLLEKCHRLEPRYLESLSAAGVLALDEVISPQHVRPRLRKSCAISFVSATSQGLLLRPHKPTDFIRVGLMAIQTGKVGSLQHLLFIEKVTLVHKHRILARKPQQLHRPCWISFPL